MKKNFSGVKVKFAEEDHLNTKNYEPDGYDSDPEMYSSNIMNPKSPTKKIREKVPKVLRANVLFIDKPKILDQIDMVRQRNL